MKPISKHLLMLALLIAAGWTAAQALPTKMLTKEEARAITYSWTDAAGASHDANLAQTAKDPYQIYAMIREVYTNPAVPGIWQATYEGPSYSSSYYTAFNAGLSERPGEAYYLTNPDNASRGRDVYYGSIDEGWDITSVTKPTQEGYTMLFVALNDGYQDYCTQARLAANPYFTAKSQVIELIENTIDSVFVVTDGIRANEGTANAGAVFSVKGYFNRFFFMTKGRANDITYGQGQYSTWYNKANPSSSSYPAANGHFGTMPLFNQMFEQFSPNDATIDTQEGYSDLTDFYSSMVNGSTYDVKHDCNSVPYQHHAFSMAGANANTHYTIAGLNIFIPDRRLETWYQQSLTAEGTSWVWSVASDNAQSVTTKVLDGRTRWDVALWGATSDSRTYTTSSPYWTYDSETGMYYTYEQDYTGEYPSQNTASTKYYFYNPKHYPKMNLYTVKLTAEAAPATSAGFYTVTLDWTSSFNVLVSDVAQKYWVYVVNADGTYSLLTTTEDVTTYSYDVPMGAPFSYTINYIVMAQPIDAQGNVFFTETWSNEDAVEIPGTSTNEQFRLVLVDNISNYTTAGEKNNYNNKLRLQNVGLTTDALQAGDNKFVFHRVDADGNDTEFATLNFRKGGAAILVSTNDLTLSGSSSSTFKVNTSEVTGTVTLTASAGFSVSPASFTADGNDHTITVSRSGSATTGTITIAATGADAQVVNLSYNASSTISTINYGNMSGTSLSASTDANGTWSYTGSGDYAYGLSGTISGVNYMYFTNDGSASYTLASGVTVGQVDVAITVASGSYGTGTLIVNGQSIVYNGSTTTNTFTGVDASSGVIRITCPGGSSGSSGYSLRIRSITITRHISATNNPTTGAVVLKPVISYANASSENNTTLNFVARPYAGTATQWMDEAIDYVNDVFSASTATNAHSPYYNYYVTFEGGSTDPDDPQPGTPVLTVAPATLTIDGIDGTTGTFTVTGSDLTGNVTVAATGGFTVSPSTITPTGGAVSQVVTVTAPTGATAQTTGAITVTADGATAQTVNVTYTPASQGGETGTLNTSIDFTSFSNGTYTNLGVDNWASTGTYVYSGEARINSGNNITYTVPTGYTNETVTVAITRSNYGSSAYMKVGVNSANYEIKSTASSDTQTWTLTVSSGDVITIMGCTSSGGNSASPYMTGITISGGN